MHKRQVIFFSILTIVVVFIIYLVFRINPGGNLETISVSTDQSMITEVVTNFGSKLQMVSLLAPAIDVKESMDREYAPYVTPELLSSWENNIPNAPGRMVSSPWPDRIEISKISANPDNSYSVTGDVIEVTSTEARNGTVADTYPATMTLQKINNIWLISSFQKGAVVIVQPNVILTDGRQCYTYSHDATKDAPYTVSEFIDITIAGTKVTGTKRGTQSGPDMTNGYSGTITGTLDKDTITDIFSYKIEGSANKEKEIYKAGLVGIEKLRYPLVEEGGILVPNTTKAFETLTYARVGCVASD